MSRHRVNDLSTKEDDYVDFSGSDAADQAFWDEFWTQEASTTEDVPLVTITIRNEETGEEKVIEKVRLQFRNSIKLRG